jgi:hypothetical protein
MSEYEIATPRPGALIESLRSIGYDLPTAVADIIDNSLTASARQVDVVFHWAGANSWICILDDGTGMSDQELFEAMRPGSQNPLQTRSSHDLGRFGLGLKTASFSQARRLTAITKTTSGPIAVREWDLDYVEREDEWRLLKEPTIDIKAWEAQLKERPSGTAVVWTKLDRLTGDDIVDDAASHNRFNDAIDHVRDYLALIFHRFLQSDELKITINCNLVKPWDPFCEQHPATYKTPVESIPFGSSSVGFRGFVLPHKDKLSPEDFKRLGGRRMCRLQGLHLAGVFLSFRGRGLVSSLDCVLLGHVFALPRRAVKTRACPVVNTCLGVSPHLAVAAAWRGRVGRFVDRARCRRWACGRTRCWRSLDLLGSGFCFGRSRWRLSG